MRGCAIGPGCIVDRLVHSGVPDEFGKNSLELIEMQSGGYLSKDDITRYEDSYGRSGPTPSATTQKPQPSG